MPHLLTFTEMVKFSGASIESSFSLFSPSELHDRIELKGSVLLASSCIGHA